MENVRGYFRKFDNGVFTVIIRTFLEAKVANKVKKF
jgi:hypothetical protein